jgi:hypothetical protein
MSGLDFTTAFPVSTITASATLWLGVFAPYLELLSGVLLAFFVIRYLVGSFNTNKNDNKNEIQ